MTTMVQLLSNKLQSSLAQQAQRLAAAAAVVKQQESPVPPEVPDLMDEDEDSCLGHAGVQVMQGPKQNAEAAGSTPSTL